MTESKRFCPHRGEAVWHAVRFLLWVKLLLYVTSFTRDSSHQLACKQEEMSAVFFFFLNILSFGKKKKCNLYSITLKTVLFSRQIVERFSYESTFTKIAEPLKFTFLDLSALLPPKKWWVGRRPGRRAAKPCSLSERTQQPAGSSVRTQLFSARHQMYFFTDILGNQVHN